MHDGSQKAITRYAEFSLLAVGTMTVMAGATIAPALPAIRTAYEHVPGVDLLVRLVLTVPALFVAVSAPFMGYVVDRFGRRRLLLGSILLYGVGGTSGLYLDSLTAILAGRAALGLSVSGIMTSGTTLVGDYFEGEQRTRFMGLLSSAMAYGGVIFLLGGGLLADVGWRMPFFIYLAAFIIFPAAFRFLPEPQRHRLSDTERRLRTSWKPAPLPVVFLIYLIAFTGFCAFYVIPTQLPFHVTELFHASNGTVGLILSLQTLVIGTVALRYRALRRRLGFAPIFGMLYFAMALGYGMIAVASDVVHVYASVIVSGVGLGLQMPNINEWLLSTTDATNRGRRVGGLTTSLFLGQFASPFVTQPVIGLLGTSGMFGTVAVFLVVLSASFGAYLIAGNRNRGKRARLRAVRKADAVH